MLSITTKSPYAVRALTELARMGGEAPVPIGELARRRDIPVQFLEQLFAVLRRAGLLQSSQRGVKGGYSFARDPAEMTVLEVVELLDGPLGAGAEGIFAEAAAAARAVLANTTSPTSSSARTARPARACTTSSSAAPTPGMEPRAGLWTDIRVDWTIVGANSGPVRAFLGPWSDETFPCSRPSSRPSSRSRSRRPGPRPRPAARPATTRSSRRTACRAAPPASGTCGAGDASDPGLRHRHQRRPGRDGPLQGRHRRRRTTGSTSTAWATTAATARARSRRSSRRSRCRRTSPACADGRDGLVDCGNWAESASWAVPAQRRPRASTSPSSCARTAATGASHVVFVVRDDDGPSDLLFQTSDTTWQAYNTYGGNSLYAGSPDGRAYKVSYNRPFTTRGNARRGLGLQRRVPDGPLARAQRLRRQLHHRRRHDRRGAELLEHELFLSVGHDEYWSGTQRANVEAARDAGVNLAFFSGNEIFWKTRWENEPTAPWSPTRRRTPTPRSTPRPALDGDLARPALQPATAAGRRTP